MTDEDRERIAIDWLKRQTIYASNPSVYYEPFCQDGRVGYRCQTNNMGDCRETFVYLNPSTDDSDGTPNIFVYEGGDNDPAIDQAHSHIALHDLEDGPLAPCGHNLYQQWGATCYGCEGA